MRQPKVENKYNIKFSDIKNLRIVDRAKIRPPLFWRNEIIGAWCISRDIGSEKDYKYGLENSAWLGIYDKPHYGKYIHCHCTSFGGMCGYKFNTFFRKQDIDHENDLLTQEFVLETVNMLIDKGILAL